MDYPENYPVDVGHEMGRAVATLQFAAERPEFRDGLIGRMGCSPDHVLAVDCFQQVGGQLPGQGG